MINVLYGLIYSWSIEIERERERSMAHEDSSDPMCLVWKFTTFIRSLCRKVEVPQLNKSYNMLDSKACWNRRCLN